jgi:Transcription factor WhiB
MGNRPAVPPAPRTSRLANMMYAVVGKWGEHANCRGMGAAMEMPIMRKTMGKYKPAILTRIRINNAKQICADCPVQTECRTWALTDPDPVNGMIAAGLTPHERQQIRQRTAS